MWKDLKKALGELLGRDKRSAQADVGMTYADLERGKARKEEQLSGAQPRDRDLEPAHR